MLVLYDSISMSNHRFSIHASSFHLLLYNALHLSLRFLIVVLLSALKQSIRHRRLLLHITLSTISLIVVILVALFLYDILGVVLMKSALLLLLLLLFVDLLVGGVGMFFMVVVVRLAVMVVVATLLVLIV